MPDATTPSDGGVPALDLERFLPYRLAVAANRTSRSLAREYRERFDLSIPEWRVLVHLAQEEAVSVREIQRRVDMDKSKVSRAASRLEARGLISKRPSAEDRRLVELALTPAGRALLAKLIPLALGWEQRLIAALGREDAARLCQLLSRVIEVTE